MYQTHKTHIKGDMKLSLLINENPMLLLFLEHLGVDFVVQDKSMKDICQEYKLEQNTVLLIANLYNGFYPSYADLDPVNDISLLISFLKNSHNYYKNDKYPQIQDYISSLKEKYSSQDINLINKFFLDYFNEVLEHLDYEDRTAFPYFCRLNSNRTVSEKENFSSNDYRNHHTDIETKLTDLKNLLLKHITIKGDITLRRQLLMSLFELEYDLNIHSLIEEEILLPIVERIENRS